MNILPIALYVLSLTQAEPVWVPVLDDSQVARAYVVCATLSQHDHWTIRDECRKIERLVMTFDTESELEGRHLNADTEALIKDVAASLSREYEPAQLSKPACDAAKKFGLHTLGQCPDDD